MTDVKGIYAGVFTLYRSYGSEGLFKAIASNLPTTSQELVPKILTDTYNIYTKHFNVYLDEEWIEVCNEVHELCHKYQCKMCNDICVELLCVLERIFLSKKQPKEVSQ
ncbi:hypothetical protein [Anaerosporobacter sp.]